MPNKFLPIKGSDVGNIVTQMNRSLSMLDKEVQTKRFTDRATGDRLDIGSTDDDTYGMQASNSDYQILMIGKYQKNRYGILLSNPDTGVPEILIGQHPKDGHMGNWQVRPGLNVIDELNS